MSGVCHSPSHPAILASIHHIALASRNAPAYEMRYDLFVLGIRFYQ